MQIRSSVLAVVCGGCLLFAGCASDLSGEVYSRDEALRTMNFREGVITSVRQVRLEGTKTSIGSGAGAVIGGVAASSIGQGKGQIISSVLGALAGGVAGAAAEEGITRQSALELGVKLYNGENILVVQEQGRDSFATGDRVRVIQGGEGRTRVTH